MSSANPENASLSILKGTVSGSFGTLALQIQGAPRGRAVTTLFVLLLAAYAIVATASPASSEAVECPSGS